MTGTNVVDEPVAEEVADESSAEELAAFDSGFSGPLDTPTVTPPADKVEQPNHAAAIPEQSTEPVVTAPEVPKLTDDEIRSLLAKVGTVDELKVSLEKLRGDAFGKVGGLERTLKQLQDSTPFGQAIEVKPEDLAELEAEFPGLNLGPSIAKGLTRVLGKLKGAGSAQPGLSQEDVDARVAAKIDETRKQDAVERLGDIHADWKEVIGPPDSTTEFRNWLKSQGAEKETKFLSSWSDRYVGKVLTEFKELKNRKLAPKVDPKPSGPSSGNRSQRLAEAVPVRGGSVAVPKGKVNEEEAAFDEGFKSR